MPTGPARRFVLLALCNLSKKKPSIYNSLVTRKSRTAIALISLPFAATLLSTPTHAQLIAPGGSGGVTGLHLPELAGILVSIIEDMFALAGVVVVIIIVVSGIRYVLSAGDPKAAQSARAALTYAILGLILILLAVTFVTVVGNFLGVPNLNIVRIPFV